VASVRRVRLLVERQDEGGNAGGSMTHRPIAAGPMAAGRTESRRREAEPQPHLRLSWIDHVRRKAGAGTFQAGQPRSWTNIPPPGPPLGRRGRVNIVDEARAVETEVALDAISGAGVRAPVQLMRRGARGRSTKIRVSDEMVDPFGGLVHQHRRPTMFRMTRTAVRS
jgi:hypothetical protein